MMVKNYKSHVMLNCIYMAITRFHHVAFVNIFIPYWCWVLHNLLSMKGASQFVWSVNVGCLTVWWWQSATVAWEGETRCFPYTTLCPTRLPEPVTRDDRSWPTETINGMNLFKFLLSTLLATLYILVSGVFHMLNRRHGTLFLSISRNSQTWILLKSNWKLSCLSSLMNYEYDFVNASLVTSSNNLM